MIPDSDDAWEVSPALIYASAGFVASLPDYLGMGTGPGPHPYMDVPSETSATLDMLRAARQFADQHQRRLARSVLITGFSQGAFPALGLAHVLGSGADPWFRVGAVAPISGPYHWSRWVHDVLAGLGTIDAKSATVYLAYLSVAWNRLHQLYASPSDWYQRPFDVDIETKMDGNHPVQEIIGFLPGSPEELLTTSAIAALEAPSGRLASAFAVIDHTCQFAATAPVRLFAAGGDPDVPIANSQECRGQLAARGAPVELVDVGQVDHLGSNVRGTANAVAWFIALRDRRVCSVDD
ncbi:MAG TPA: hypothetical protein VHW23_25190 [Kofleriaceae bacterium]|nr:hypothetical protein [Kofleriaceae bacterium]